MTKKEKYDIFPMINKNTTYKKKKNPRMGYRMQILKDNDSEVEL